MASVQNPEADAICRELLKVMAANQAAEEQAREDELDALIEQANQYEPTEADMEAKDRVDLEMALIDADRNDYLTEVLRGMLARGYTFRWETLKLFVAEHKRQLDSVEVPF